MYQRCQMDHDRTSAKNGSWLCAPSAYRATLGLVDVSVDLTPKCGSLGGGGGLVLSCAKKITFMAPTLGTCATNEDHDAGLCYSKCNPNYTGVGPVCWGRPPALWMLPTCDKVAAFISNKQWVASFLEFRRR
ncbi:hypothetical protein AaE_008609 [Aphanomyces astaci]|uniref:Uncharacterized protein n=1 Tax=Aphanomyces astaci TaxID=112090 RepID=A0A6A4ZZF8_APHAT|nr:hypothetical protein AaE_008609 [Aphanomyces astaci]